MPCCSSRLRCLLAGLFAAFLVIGGSACSNPASSTPSSKASTQEGSPKVKEPVDPR